VQGEGPAPQLRNQAKTLQRFVQAGVPQTLEVVREFHPRLGDIITRAVARRPGQLSTATD
jgi:hypothetical protein